MSKFFDDLLFSEQAVYTLWGSKPITEIVMYHYNEEEWSIISNEFTAEEKKNCHIDKDYDLPQNWEKWEKISLRFPMNRYLLFRSHFDDDGKASFLYLVDVIKTAVTIEENYQLFRDEVGFDFHPLETSLQISNPQSIFWNNVRKSKKSMLLWGLLFGYGKINSYAFYWKHCNHSGSCASFMRNFPSQFSNPLPIGQKQISFENFELPSFISYTTNDEVVTQYKKEREDIRKVYSNRNRLELTLQKLMN
ncbi:MAG: hypothetical protein RLZZ453_794 [Chlamydiota bacterium]|jgi:hypothetical protein